MDFSRQGIEKEKDALKSPVTRTANRVGVTVLRVILYLLIASAVALICMGVGAYRGIIADAPDITEANITPSGNATFLYDSDGNEIQKLSSVEGNRESVSLDEIPEDMQHAIVAIEDSRFYEHNGVDPHGMIRAIMVALSSNFEESEGASTITQQLLKNNVFTDWMDETRIERIKRKIQEQYLAVQLEKSLREAGQDPKAVILENYLNTVNFGSGAYGVQTAAQTYFGKDVSDLTLSECAVLAAIPQNPSQYNPKLYPEENAKRMKVVLQYMLEQGYITQDEYDEAIADDVYSRIKDQDESTSTESDVYSYFVDEVIDQVQSDLMTKKGYSESEAYDAIYNGGLKIYTTQDSDIQAILEDEFTNEDNFPASSQVELDWALTVDTADGERVNYSVEELEAYMQENVDPDFDLFFSSEDEAQTYIDQYKAAVVGSDDTIVAERTSYTPEPQACMTIIDQSTGYVVGIVGGRGEKEASLSLNRATDSLRQPEGTLRILSSYGPALQNGTVTLATTESATVKTESDSGTTSTSTVNMSVRDAIVSGSSAIANVVLQQIAPSTGYDFLEKLGFSHLDEDYDSSSNLAYGTTSEGVTNLELTAAYAAIANNGTYNEPVFYTKVVDSDGNVLLENTSMPQSVFSESTSYLLTNAMEEELTSSSGTGTAFQLSNTGISVAGQTGTTESDIDMQFVGFTPYYTAGIWTGYDSSQELSDDEKNYIATLWTNVMNRIHEGLDDATFEQPSTVEELTICSESGLLAGTGCTTTTEVFSTAYAPTETCTQHKPTPTPTATATPTPTEAAVTAEPTDDTTDTDTSDDTTTEDTTTDTTDTATDTTTDTGGTG
ncbi:MAG: transglycosylase domain-containing protein [Eubacteriales bacterium]